MALFPTSITQWMRKFIKRTGLPDTCVHSLRHTYASLLISEGIPVSAVAGNLGHAQVSTTTKIYTHVIAETAAAAAAVTDIFSEVIHPKKSDAG